MEPFPNIRAYVDRIAARPAYQSALELDGEQQFYGKDFYEVEG